MSLTAWFGVLSLGIAGGWLVIAALIRKSKLIGCCGLAYWLLAFEVWLGSRHDLHEIVTTILKENDQYNDRRLLQVVMIVSVVIGLLVLSLLAFWVSRLDALEKRVCVVTTATIGLFAAETISLHAVDAWLYFKTGPILAIAILWAALALITIAIVVTGMGRERKT